LKASSVGKDEDDCHISSLWMQDCVSSFYTSLMARLPLCVTQDESHAQNSIAGQVGFVFETRSAMAVR
jgi:hypothetical protein